MNTTVERQRRKGVMSVVGRGLKRGVAVCLYKYTTTLSNTQIHTVTPFSIRQENGEWEMIERKKEGERAWTQVSHYPPGLFGGYSYKII